MSDLPLLEPSTGSDSSDSISSDSISSDPAGSDPSTGRGHRNRNVILAILGGIVVILVVVAGLAWHYLGEQTTALKPPGTIAGLTLDESDNAKQTAEYLRTALAAKISLNDNVGAVYRDPAGSDRDVLFFGGTALILNPAKDLDQALALLNDSSGTVNDLHEIASGALGGVMKCGTSTGDGGPMSVCGWADRGSLGVALFPGRPLDEAGQLLRDLRAGVERVS